MGKKKLLSLAKELDFSDEFEYFDYLCDSHINGNFSQCRKLFSEMKKEDQKKFLKYIKNEVEIFNFYFELI